MTVAVDDLRRDGLDEEAEPAADLLLEVGRDGCVGADGAGDLADGYLLLRLRQAMRVAAHLVVPGGELEAEGGGLGVDAVAPAHAYGVLVLLRADGERLHERVDVLLKQFGGLDQAEGEGGVLDVVGGKAEVDEARLLAEAVGDRAEEGIEVVVHLALVLGGAFGVIAGASDLLHRLDGDDTAFGPGLANGDLDAE